MKRRAVVIPVNLFKLQESPFHRHLEKTVYADEMVVPSIDLARPRGPGRVGHDPLNPGVSFPPSIDHGVFTDAARAA
jgi:hypothetical protein